MKVLVGSLSRHFGGVESLFRTIVMTDKSGRQKYDFICTDTSAAREEDFLAAGSQVIHIKRPSKDIWEYIRSFKNLFKNCGYEIYHVNLTRFRFPLDVLICKICGKKVVLHCHSTRIYTNVDRKTQLIRNFEQVLFKPIMLKCSDMNIACSKRAGEYLYGKKPFKIIYNGIDTDAFIFDKNGRDKIRSEIGFVNCKVVGHIGRFSIEKNHIFFLKVAKKLIELDSNYRFICVGDGELLPEIINRAEELGISKNIAFTGHRNDTKDLLSAMDLFLFPSIHEALPITLIEAQATGLPCVVSDCVTDEIGVNELIERINLNTSIDEWTTTVEEKINIIRQRSYQTIDLSDFDIYKMLDKLNGIYQELMI